MPEDSVDLSIIIVSFNTKDLTVSCLEKLTGAKQAQDRWEIIVVDNASTDGSVEAVATYKKMQKLSFLSVLTSSTNLGYAKANNRGIEISRGRFVLLLNSDTEVSSQSIQHMLTVIKDPDVGAATGKLVLSDGSLDPACHRGFPTPWAALTYFLGLERLFPRSRLFSHYHLGYKKRHVPHQVDVISGAFFMIRREVIAKVGKLDEDYFMYGEDIDWCFRIRSLGYRIMFDPRAVILHRKKQSGRQSGDKALEAKTTGYFYETMRLFYEKHYRDKYPSIITHFILFLLTIRLRIVRVLGR